MNYKILSLNLIVKLKKLSTSYTLYGLNFLENLAKREHNSPNLRYISIRHAAQIQSIPCFQVFTILVLVKRRRRRNLITLISYLERLNGFFSAVYFKPHTLYQIR